MNHATTVPLAVALGWREPDEPEDSFEEIAAALAALAEGDSK
jgi:hypothetical protein